MINAVDSQHTLSRRYRLIFVDDEAIVREGIGSCIDWKTAGFELCACLEHGIQVLDYLKEESVDVIISDINMPRMDGLALSRKLFEEYPHIKVILLTGYDEFEYAQEALNNHVSKFLLKPITSEELLHVLIQVHDELDQIYRSAEQQRELRDKLEQSLPLVKERFLNRMVRGTVSLEQIKQKGTDIGWNSVSGYYQTALITPDQSWSDIQTLELAEMAESIAAEGDIVFRNYEEQIILLFQGLREEMLATRSKMVISQIHRFSGTINSSRVSIGLGIIVSSPGEIPSSYRSAVNAVNYSRSLGLNQILSVMDFQKDQSKSPELFYDSISKLTSSIQSGNHSETSEKVSKLFSLFETHLLSQEEIQFYLDQLYIRLQQSISEIGVFETGDKKEQSAIIHPKIFSTLQEAKEYLNEIVSEYEKLLAGLRSSTVENRIHRAKEIIEQRFCDKNFGLQTICNELFLSTSQFSYIFKEGTGGTFLEFVTARRIEEAKRLLKSSDLKGYEIAELVGFSDPRYFSIVFKKQCGMTAMQYRRSLDT